MSLVTDADVLAYVQSTGRCIPAALRALAGQLRLTAENLVKEKLGYNVEQADYDELHPSKANSTRAEGDIAAIGFDLIGGTVVPRDTFPSNRRELVLLQLPVRTITAVYDNPGAWNTAGGSWTTALATNAYYLDTDYVGQPCWSGILRRNVGSWGTVPRSIKVTYTAGLTASELATRYTEFGMAVKVACAKIFADALARANMARTGRGPMQSVGIEDFSWAQAAGNQAMIGSYLGAGIASATLPTEAYQWIAGRIHPAAYF